MREYTWENLLKTSSNSISPKPFYDIRNKFKKDSILKNWSEKKFPEHLQVTLVSNTNYFKKF